MEKQCGRSVCDPLRFHGMDETEFVHVLPAKAGEILLELI